ncbi:MAG: DUF5667 domain-containing protein [bacterium]|nr:DUF5667 domain-containing protein [bacterium]
MRNFLWVSVSLFFASVILGVSVVRTTAQTQPKFKLSLATVIPSPTPAEALTETKVDYSLPYPGILPDHFLYSLKMARDKVVLTLTFDSQKKAEMMLLFADKRLGAGRTLIEGGKVQLGVTTLSKGEKYLESAAIEAEKAKRGGKDASALIEKLGKSYLKHQETLAELETKIPNELKPTFEAANKSSRSAFEIIERNK